MSAQIDPTRLAAVITLAAGAHGDHKAMCAMEAAAYIAGEPWSDRPQCVCPTIATFVRAWNDGIPDVDRTRLLLPLIPLTIGTRGSPDLSKRRGFMALDWLVRVHTVAWLRLAKLDTHAEALAALPQLIDDNVVMVAANTMAAARDAARAAASDAASAAARDAARAAASAAARAAAWDAARDATSDAAWDAASAAARAAAWDAARAAAWDAASDALSRTVTQLQASASELVERMCALEETDNG